MKKYGKVLGSLIVGILLVAALLYTASSAMAGDGPGVPDGGGAVYSWSTAVLNKATTSLTTTVAKPSAADSWVGYSRGEYFVTFAPTLVTTTVYLTPQVSFDSINWVNLTYTYLSDGLISTSVVVTSTGVTTATNTSTGSSSIATASYGQSITGSGTSLFRLPAVGVYTRMLMTLSQADTTVMTVNLVKKNGGN